MTPEDFDEYKQYFAALVTSEKYVQMLRRHPELVWEHDENGAYHTVAITDMSAALDPSLPSE